jgi:hypothetical protein
MKKKIFSFLFLILMFFTKNTNASEILYNNARFDNIYIESKDYLEKGDYEKSKEKIYEYLDKTNLLYCNSYDILIELSDKTNKEYISEYEKLKRSCEAFKI